MFNVSRFMATVRFSSSTLLLALLIGLLLAADMSAVSAQDGWSGSAILFQPQEDRIDQGLSLVPDGYGNAHLVWTHLDRNGEEPPVFYYTRWDRTTWTTPVDIIVVSAGWPVLVASTSGKLHIFWNTGTFLYHSWAPALAANTSRAWSAAEVVVSCEEGCSIPMDALEDNNGILHIVYSHRQGSAYYLYSEDEGVTWSSPSPVSALPRNTTTLAPKIAVADDGRIHAVWPEIRLPEEEYLRLSYAYSTDRGRSWTPPLELGAGNQADGNLLAVGNDEVHLAWNGGVGVGGRYYMRSDDGGVSWSQPERISSGTGRASYPSIARDSLGNLNILTGQGEYISQTDSRWNPAEELPFFAETNEHSRLAVVSGNQLVAVTPRYFSGIFLSVKALNIPAVPTRSYPEFTPAETPALLPPTSGPVTPSAPQATPTTLPDTTFSDDRPAASMALVFPISVALLTVVLGVGIRKLLS